MGYNMSKNYLAEMLKNYNTEVVTEVMIKRAAKKLKKETEHTHAESLELVVKSIGFRNYNDWINHNKKAKT